MQVRYDKTLERVAAACDTAGRPSHSVAVVAVTKRHSEKTIRALQALGHRRFGENYVQEWKAKHEATADIDLTWDFIGRLQRNKAKYVVGQVGLLHCVDSQRLLETIATTASARGVVQAFLIAVNVADEGSKSGIEPSELPALLARADELAPVRCVGLFTMPPLRSDPEQNRQVFAALRDLRDHHATNHPGLTELSMGTSHDFECAIAEGATIVRLGTVLVGPRPS